MKSMMPHIILQVPESGTCFFVSQYPVSGQRYTVSSQGYTIQKSR